MQMFGKSLLPLCFYFLLVCLLPSNSSFGQTKEKLYKVFVLTVRAEIDPSSSRYLELGLEEAKEHAADIIIIDLDTYGGALNSADEMRKMLLDCEIPIWVFINKNAASAGALISIASDSIYMAPGANIGAATVVTQDGTPAPDKFQSYMRSLMRSTAQANGRDPKIAERMVGQAVGSDSAIVGNVLSFTTEEALANNYAEAKVLSIQEILKINGITNFTIQKFELSFLEKIISLFLNPYLRSILILLILGGIYFELQSPGIGFPLLVSVIAAILYFVPSYLNGLAANWEILIFILGIGLIALEIFVIPGFGVAGIAGILLTFGALILVMLNNDFLDFSNVEASAFSEAIVVLIVALAGAIILFAFGWPKLLESKYMNHIALKESFDSSKGYNPNMFDKATLIGKHGVAHTVLRPSGKVTIDDIVYDAYSQGEFIERGMEVIVIDCTTTSLKVKPVGPSEFV